MCNRYSNVQEEEQFIDNIEAQLPGFWRKPSDQHFSFLQTSGFKHEVLPVITQEQPLQISYKQWGLIPAATKTPEEKNDVWKKGFTLNARGETIFIKPTWKDSAQRRRCLIPATAFFEWRDYQGVKYPYLIQLVNPNFPDDTTPFCMAGLYDLYIDKATGQEFKTFAIVTTEANDLVKRIHVNPKREDNGARQPVIILPEQYKTWLNPSATFQQLDELLKPVPSEMIRAYTITKDITKSGFNFNDPAFLQHVAFDIPGTAFNIGEI